MNTNYILFWITVQVFIHNGAQKQRPIHCETTQSTTNTKQKEKMRKFAIKNIKT